MVKSTVVGMGRTKGLLVGIAALVLVGAVTALAVRDDPAKGSSDLVGAAGGGDSSAPSSTTSTTSAPAPEAKRGAASGSGSAPAETTTTTVAAAGNATTGTAETTGTTRPTYTYKVTVEPTCALVGTPMTATLHVKKEVGGIVLVTYTGTDHRDQHAAFADEDGKITFTWTAPDAPGEGWVITEVHDDETKAGGRTDVSIRIVRPGQSC